MKYKNKSTYLIVSPDEFRGILCYLSDRGFNVYIWFWDAERNRGMKVFSKEEIKTIDWFSRITRIYITKNNIDVDDFLFKTEEPKVYAAADVWRNLWEKNELIEISNISVLAEGIHCTINYTDCCKDAGKKIISKSKEFIGQIILFDTWLNANYRNNIY